MPILLVGLSLPSLPTVSPVLCMLQGPPLVSIAHHGEGGNRVGGVEVISNSHDPVRHLGSWSRRTEFRGVGQPETGIYTPENSVERHASDSILGRDMNRKTEGTDNAAVTHFAAAFVVLPNGWGMA